LRLLFAEGKHRYGLDAAVLDRRAPALGAALSFAFMIPYNKSWDWSCVPGWLAGRQETSLAKGQQVWPEDGRTSHIVLVGSSTGGVKALLEIVSTLPGACPSP
jgi:chemotaxis response regulator CheB